MAHEVPWLRSGCGETPADGGCVMQVIDWISRNEWTDQPPCVHPVLRKLAIRANDQMGDNERQKLLGLAPRLMNTASDDKTLSVKLAVFCARHVLPIFEGKHPADDRPRKAIEAAEAWIDDPSVENLEAARNAAANAANAAANAANAANAAANAANAAAYAADAAAYAADAAAYADAANAAADADAYPFLLAVLDEYDRLTERKQTCVVDLSSAALVMAGV